MDMEIRKALVLIYLFLTSATHAYAADYYVSPAGSDANSGTSQSAPVKTFNKAWQLLYPGDTLYLMDGTYYQSLEPNVRDGGPNPVININDYTAYPLDHPQRIKNYITVKALNDGKTII